MTFLVFGRLDDSSLKMKNGGPLVPVKTCWDIFPSELAFSLSFLLDLLLLVCENYSYLADFALQFLDDFLSFHWFNFQGVKVARRPKLQLHRVLHPLHCTVFCSFTDGHKIVRVKDF